MGHEYEGGAIQPLGDADVPEHYHVDYFIVSLDSFEWGYEIDVAAHDFIVFDDEAELFRAQTLDDAVRFCFERYQEQHPGQTITPCWGAGAPNGALERLGYKPS
jgi:hypothetical protein